MSRKGSKGGSGKLKGGQLSFTKIAKKLKISKGTLINDTKHLLSNFTEDEIVEIFK